MAACNGPMSETGFEEKNFRQVIENYLYHTDREIMVAAAIELRKRLKRMYPQPDWAKKMFGPV